MKTTRNLTIAFFLVLLGGAFAVPGTASAGHRNQDVQFVISFGNLGLVPALIPAVPPPRHVTYEKHVYYDAPAYYRGRHGHHHKGWRKNERRRDWHQREYYNHRSAPQHRDKRHGHR